MQRSVVRVRGCVRVCRGTRRRAIVCGLMTARVPAAIPNVHAHACLSKQYHARDAGLTSGKEHEEQSSGHGSRNPPSRACSSARSTSAARADGPSPPSGRRRRLPRPCGPGRARPEGRCGAAWLPPQCVRARPDLVRARALRLRRSGRNRSDCFRRRKKNRALVVKASRSSKDI
eukprot:1212860-Pleurochrysis_carterae.AAC.2